MPVSPRPFIKKDVDWKWGTTEQIAFENLKIGLCADQVMAHPRVNDPYILYTDACDYTLGGILCRVDGNGI